MTGPTIELVTFQLKPGAERAAFEAANEAADRFLAGQPGSVGRSAGAPLDAVASGA